MVEHNRALGSSADNPVTPSLPVATGSDGSLVASGQLLDDSNQSYRKSSVTPADLVTLIYGYDRDPCNP